MTIDGSAEDENTEDSIRLSLEFDSNEIDESKLQNAKHLEPKISTVAGITID
jgi:hypothetical protein